MENIHIYTHTYMHIDAHHRAFVELNVADLFVRSSGFRNSVLLSAIIMLPIIIVFIFENLFNYIHHLQIIF